MQRYINYWRDHPRTLLATILFTTIILVITMVWALSVVTLSFANQWYRGEAQETLIIINFMYHCALFALILEVVSMVAIIELRRLALAKSVSILKRTAIKALIIAFPIMGLAYLSEGSISWLLIALLCLWGVGLLGAIVGMQLIVQSFATPIAQDGRSDMPRHRAIIYRYSGRALLIVSSIVLTVMLWIDAASTGFCAVLSIVIFSILGIIALPTMLQEESLERGSLHGPMAGPLT